MCLYKIVMIIVMLLSSFLFAQEQKNKDTQPQLSIQQSNFVEFKNSKINVSNGTITFEGNFVVLGEAIYGHFEMVTHDSSGKMIQKMMSEDRAWKRDHGGKLKNIALTMSTDAPEKVEISFHEMRTDTNSGVSQ